MAEPSAISSLSPEIALGICQHISLREGAASVDIHRDLVALAITCRSLSEPALDTLWHTISSLAPLLLTLPKDLCAVAPLCFKQYAYIGTQLVMVRAPVPEDFTRFFTYSRRVKNFHFSKAGLDLRAGEMFALHRDPDPDYHAAPDPQRRAIVESSHFVSYGAWDFLLAFGPRPLLPNLLAVRHWEWVGHRAIPGPRIPFHAADLLFGPRLRKVDVRCHDILPDTARATDIIRSLSHIATSRVEHINIEGGVSVYRGRRVSSLSGTEILSFHDLTSFSGRSVHVAPDALVALGQLPYLEALLLHVNPEEYSWDTLIHGRCADLFPALLRLTLHDIGIKWCTSFLRMVSSTALREMSVVCARELPTPPPAVLKALCSAISTLPSFRSILDLFISIGAAPYHLSRPYRAHELYRLHDIAPLLALPAMQRLVITGKCTTIVNDFALEAMSQSWPDITELRITWDFSVRLRADEHGRSIEDVDYPYATPSGLLHLARRCPRLTKLALPLDLRIHPTDPESRAACAPPVCLSGPGVPALQELDATGSLVGDEMCIAAFLSLLFPRLSRIQDQWERLDEWDVEYYRTLFARIRLQERKFGQRCGRRFLQPVPDIPEVAP